MEIADFCPPLADNRAVCIFLARPMFSERCFSRRASRLARRSTLFSLDLAPTAYLMLKRAAATPF